MITLNRLGQIRANSHNVKTGYSGLGAGEAKELLDAAEEGIVLKILADLLLERRAMEPKHSREDHDCAECAAFDELKRLEKERIGAQR